MFEKDYLSPRHFSNFEKNIRERTCRARENISRGKTSPDRSTSRKRPLRKFADFSQTYRLYLFATRRCILERAIAIDNRCIKRRRDGTTVYFANAQRSRAARISEP